MGASHVEPRHRDCGVRCRAVPSLGAPQPGGFPRQKHQPGRVKGSSGLLGEVVTTEVRLPGDGHRMRGRCDLFPPRASEGRRQAQEVPWLPGVPEACGLVAGRAGPLPNLWTCARTRAGFAMRKHPDPKSVHWALEQAGQWVEQGQPQVPGS